MSDYRVERRVQSLAREVRRLGAALDTATGHLQAMRADAEPLKGVSNLEIAEGILAARRLREDLFGAEMFADPAWDMLLHLFINAERGRAVPVSCLCVASTVPQSTALRWIDTLANAGFVDRRLDSKDGRRILVSLAPEAETLMRLHLRRTRSAFMMLGDTGRRNGAAAAPFRSSSGL
jgi:DNA-binding transcriptional ArsR family regulator